MSAVLLVEDDQLISMVFAEALSNAGFEVHCEYDGKGAIAAADIHFLQAAIVDVGLPDMSGEDVARELRTRYPTMPIVVCTGHHSRVVAAWAVTDNVHVVEKPIDEARLVALLRAQVSPTNLSSLV